jgi:hypothetical protein
MSAFCLATSSSSDDAVQHFHHVRMEAIGFQLETNDVRHENVLQALKLYIYTLQTTRDIISGRLSESLGKLKLHPVLDDSDVQRMDLLDTDILRRWLPDGIRNFTPWIKYNDLPKHEAETMIKHWSKEAFGKLKGGMSQNLEKWDDFSDILLLRRSLLVSWLPVHDSAPCHSSVEVLDGIRSVINRRLISILRAQAKGLILLGLDISSIVASWDEAREESATLSLWEPNLTLLDYSDGAATFKEEIINRTLGKDKNVLSVLDSYHTWLVAIGNRKDLIEELQRTRWEDIVEDVEADDALLSVGRTLNQVDPLLLLKEHEDTLVKAFTTLQTSLQSALADMTGRYRACQAAFILRVIREVRRSIPNELLNCQLDFGHEVESKLHQVLATEIVSQLSPSNLTRVLRDPGIRCAGRTLWEGDPQLPVQPSPPAFKLLRQLVSAMEQQGPDVWNVTAVDLVKTQLKNQIASTVRSSLESDQPTDRQSATSGNFAPLSRRDGAHGNSSVEGAMTMITSTLATDSNVRDLKFQLLFDVLYLGEALSVRNPLKSGETDLGPISELLQRLINPPQASLDRLRKQSQTYWKKTMLLFGLLG